MDKLRSVLYAEKEDVRACMLSLIDEPQDTMYAEIPVEHDAAEAEPAVV